MVDIDPSQDYYAVLGITMDASLDDIRHAYRRMVKATHPDSGSGDTELFRTVQDAYTILSSPDLRDAYDRLRFARGSGTAPLVIDAAQSRAEMQAMEDEQVLYVTLDLIPRPDLGESRRNLNLAIVIDRSTSMRDVRMQNVKAAAQDLVDSLTPDDRLAVIAFSDRAEVVVPSAPVTDKIRLRSALMSIIPEGGTEIYQGLAAGIDQVRPHLRNDAISHVLLLTDGRTYGDERLALAAAARAQADGISISCFGIGEDWHDVFLDDLARQGGGASHYIDAPSKIRAALRALIRELGAMVLLGTRVRVTTAPGVRLAGAYRAAPYMESLRDDGTGALALGNLTAKMAVVLALEFVVSLSDIGAHRIARVTVEGEDVAKGKLVGLWRDIWVTLTEAPSDMTVPSRLLSILGRLSIFTLQERAWRALELGSHDEATQDLTAAATHLFDLGYHELAQATMLEAGRISQGDDPTGKGRKQIRYGTRALTAPPSWVPS